MPMVLTLKLRISPEDFKDKEYFLREELFIEKMITTSEIMAHLHKVHRGRATLEAITRIDVIQPGSKVEVEMAGRASNVRES